MVRAKKIERRRTQIAALTKRIKMLTTRRQTAQRSLAALERAEKRPEPKKEIKP